MISPRLCMIVAVLCGTLASTHLSAAAPTGPTAALAEPASDARYGAVVQRVLALGVPGVAVRVEQRGQILYQNASGYADVELRVPLATDQVFSVGSITKSFTALGIAQLVSERKIGLDEAIGTYVPNLPAEIARLPVRSLLNHTAGLLNYTSLPEMQDLRYATRTREQMKALIASQPPGFPVGTAWDYSNAGTYLLGLAIENVSGVSYADYIETRIAKPYGLGSTRVQDWRPTVPRRVKGYALTRSGLKNAEQIDPTIPFAAGAILSTLDDLSRYLRQIVDTTTAPSVRSQRLQRDRLTDGTLLDYTLGGLIISDVSGHRKIGHSGDISGFAATMAYYPEDDLSIVILTNASGSPVPPASLERKFARIALKLPDPPKPEPMPPGGQLAKLEGQYRFAPVRFRINDISIRVKDGNLAVVLGTSGTAPVIPLVHTGKNRFVSMVDDEHVFTFDPRRKSLRMEYYGNSVIGQRFNPGRSSAPVAPR